MLALVLAVLALSPKPALATGGNTGTTEVSVQAGPDWGQKTETVGVNRSKRDGLAQTGDSAEWQLVLLLGAAAASGGLLVTMNDKRDEGAADDADA